MIWLKAVARGAELFNELLRENASEQVDSKVLLLYQIEIHFSTFISITTKSSESSAF
jgi:hypothetical protein